MSVIVMFFCIILYKEIHTYSLYLDSTKVCKHGSITTFCSGSRGGLFIIMDINSGI